jgi:hypothetical protein
MTLSLCDVVLKGIVMLIVVMPSVVMPSVVMPSVVMPSVVMPSVVLPSVFIPKVGAPVASFDGIEFYLSISTLFSHSFFIIEVLSNCRKFIRGMSLIFLHSFARVRYSKLECF